MKITIEAMELSRTITDYEMKIMKLKNELKELKQQKENDINQRYEQYVSEQKENH